MQFATTTNSSSISVVTIQAENPLPRLDQMGRRMGLFSRIRYAVLVLLGKRRNYPICICAFGNDDDDDD